MATTSLTPHQITPTRIAAIRSVCKESFADFCKLFWETLPGVPELVWNWHLDLFCEELQYIAERVFLNKPKEHDLLCNVSPGSSKSSVWSILFNAWVWTRMAEARFIVATNTERLALDLAYKTKMVIESDLYRQCFPEVQIQPDRSAKGDFSNTCGGERLSCTVGGQSPIGRHAHFLICDDPLDPTKALSEVELESAKIFMEQVLPSRKVRTNVDLAVTCLIMQRLHMEDPAGIWIKKWRNGKMKLKWICIPAEIISNERNIEKVHPPTLIDNYRDGLMDPVRLPLSVLDERREDNLYAYAGQFLQNPTPLEGGMFKYDYFKDRKRAAPYNATRVRGWDRASSEGKGCRTAGVLMAKDDEGNFYVEHVVVGQWEPFERNEVMLHTARMDRARYGPNHEPIIYVEAEGGSSGRDAWKAIARHLAGFPVREERVTGNKVARAESWSSALAAGIVSLIDNGESTNTGKATWNIEEYINEHCHFPFGTWIDLVDSSTLCFNILKGKKVTSGSPLRVITIGGRNNDPTRIVVCHRDEMSSLESHLFSLVIHIDDPDKQVDDLPIPVAMSNVIGTLLLQFADIQPTEYQDKWEETVLEFGKKPEELVMSHKHGKSLWNFILKSRGAQPGMVVLVAPNRDDRRALSIACGIADVLRISYDRIYRPYDDEHVKSPPNSHVHAMTKHCRTLVSP